MDDYRHCFEQEIQNQLYVRVGCFAGSPRHAFHLYEVKDVANCLFEPMLNCPEVVWLLTWTVRIFGCLDVGHDPRAQHCRSAKAFLYRQRSWSCPPEDVTDP